MATDATSQATDPTKDGAENKQEKTQAPVYTPEQQAHFDGVIKEVTARTAKEEREKAKRLESENAEIRTKLSELEKAIKKPDKSPDSKDDVAEMERVNKELRTEMDGYRNTILQKEDSIKAINTEKADLRKRFAMQMAATGIPFHKWELVEIMTRDFIREDENGKFYAVDDNGTTRRNQRMEVMQLPEFYSEFAGKEKWSVKSDYVAGAGSSESAQGAGKTKVRPEELWGKDAVKNAAAIEMQIKKDSREEWLRLSEEGKAKGLLGG